MASSNPLITAAMTLTRQISPDSVRAMLQEPVIIVSAPRSGSNLLFEQMAKVAGFWSIGGESHGIYRAFPRLRAENSRMDSGSLGASHADPETRRLMRACFLCLLRDHEGNRYLDLAPERRPSCITFLEKTPRNALNIPFLLEVFPGARFIYLHRDPRENIASIIEAWNMGLQTGRFVTFRDLPGWDRQGWCFLLPPGWQSMIGRPVPEIAAFQWVASNNAILDGLDSLPASRWVSVSYRDLVACPVETLTDLCRFAGISPCDRPMLTGPLPVSRTALTPPHPDKWKKYERELADLSPGLSSTLARIESIEVDQVVG